MSRAPGSPMRATAILLEAEAQLLPYLADKPEAFVRLFLADLASLAVRLDGTDAAPLFGQTPGTRKYIEADRIVLARLAKKRAPSKKAPDSNVAQHLPLSKGDRARSKKPRH